MTREELKAHCEKQIKMCEMWAKHIGEEPNNKIYEEHKLILELLEQEPCEDAISRQAVLDAFADYVGSGMSMNDFDALWDIVVKIQPVNSQPKTGHWIYRIYGEFHEEGNWHCSGCDYIFNGGYGHAKYCPECGCKMSEAPTEEVKRI